MTRRCPGVSPLLAMPRVEKARSTRSRGAPPPFTTCLRSKVLGGACPLDPSRGERGDLGGKNAKRAFGIFEAQEISLVSRDEEGRRGEKLIFAVAAGEAWVERI